MLFGIVPKAIWEKRIEPDERNRVPLAFNCYVIETGDHTILVETGGGHEFDERARERMNLPNRVASIREVLLVHGVDYERIDVVINTHLHWDHCSGNMFEERAAFPNAQYFTQRGEWEYAHERSPRDSISYHNRNYDPLVECGQMTLLTGNADIVPGISVEVAPGHNRDMMVVKTQSRGETFCMLADLVPTAEHLKLTWVAAFDLYPVRAMETRKKLLTQAAREGWWLGFGHDMKHAFARVSEDQKVLESVS